MSENEKHGFLSLYGKSSGGYIIFLNKLRSLKFYDHLTFINILTKLVNYTQKNNQVVNIFWHNLMYMHDVSIYVGFMTLFYMRENLI